MERIDRSIYKDDYREANRELINKCMDRMDEIVEWVNAHDEDYEVEGGERDGRD